MLTGFSWSSNRSSRSGSSSSGSGSGSGSISGRSSSRSTTSVSSSRSDCGECFFSGVNSLIPVFDPRFESRSAAGRGQDAAAPVNPRDPQFFAGKGGGFVTP